MTEKELKDLLINYGITDFTEEWFKDFQMLVSLILATKRISPGVAIEKALKKMGIKDKWAKKRRVNRVMRNGNIDTLMDRLEQKLEKQGRKFLTVEEVAQIIGKSSATVYREIKLLNLKATQFKGNWIITVADLREYLQEKNNYNQD